MTRLAVGLIVALALALGASTPTAAQDLDCIDFATQAEAQGFYEANGGPGADPHRLDSDGNGLACEGLP